FHPRNKLTGLSDSRTIFVRLADLGIDLASLEFESLQPQPVITGETIPPLSIAQAKAGLAQHFGVNPDQIEIVIKG
ncbi:MAG: hypothetical protein EA366_11225, partial [Spirulina sp. DLM2.Bin59]